MYPMKKRSADMDIIEIDVNHYEIVISNKVVDIIKHRMEQLK